MYVPIIRSWLCLKRIFTLLYTTLNFKDYKANNATGASANRKNCVTLLREGGEGSPQERPYDVSRGQNRFVALPLNDDSTVENTHVHYCSCAYCS